MRDFYVEFEPNARGQKAGASCMSYQILALTASEAIAVATNLLKSCGERLEQYTRPSAIEQGDAA